MPCKNCLRCVQRKNSFLKVPYRILCHKRRLNGIGSHLTEIFICSFIQQKSTDHSTVDTSVSIGDTQRTRQIRPLLSQSLCCSGGTDRGREHKHISALQDINGVMCQSGKVSQKSDIWAETSVIREKTQWEELREGAFGQKKSQNSEIRIKKREERV